MQIIMNIGNVTPSKDEKEKYIEQYMPMHYFRTADEYWYYCLQTELLAASYRDWNGYPKILQR